MSNATFTLAESVVSSIGRAEVKRDKTAADIVATMPEGYDWTARGAVAEAIRTVGGWDADTCPARKKGPKGAQVTTVFGVGFQALEDAIRKIVKEDKVPTVALRATLSGEGGGSVTVDMDSELGKALLALILAGDE